MTAGLVELKSIGDVRMNQKVLIINTTNGVFSDKTVEKIETELVHFGKYESFKFGLCDRLFEYDEGVVKTLKKLKEKHNNDIKQLIENGTLIYNKLEAIEQLGQKTIEKVKKKMLKYIKDEIKELSRKIK